VALIRTIVLKYLNVKHGWVGVGKRAKGDSGEGLAAAARGGRGAWGGRRTSGPTSPRQRRKEWGGSEAGRARNPERGSQNRKMLGEDGRSGGNGA